MQKHNQLKWGPIAFIVAMVAIVSLVTLWQYKELVGVTFLGLLIAAVAVALRSSLNEQGLRNLRYQPQQEEPLPREQQPLYLQEQHRDLRPVADVEQQQLHVYDERG